jgi:phospholipid/cholesterol/gamma-HCH transport system substrate-binding protein
MVTRAQRVRLAVFVIVVTAALAGFLAVVGGRRLLERRIPYVVAYRGTSISGLQVGGTVRYQGVDVGTVEAIRFSQGDIRTVLVSISVREGTPVRTDVTAALTPVGITGLMQIELTGGSNSAPAAPAGYLIEGGKSPLDRILAPAETIAVQLQAILGSVSALMSAENQQRFNRILTNVDQFVGETREPMVGIVRNMQATTAGLSETVGSVNQLLARIDRAVSEAEVVAVTRNLNETISQARETIANIDVTVLRARRDLIDSLAALRETVESLSDFAQLISENPSLLIRQRGRDQ